MKQFLLILLSLPVVYSCGQETKTSYKEKPTELIYSDSLIGVIQTSEERSYKFQLDSGKIVKTGYKEYGWNMKYKVNQYGQKEYYIYYDNDGTIKDSTFNTYSNEQVLLKRTRISSSDTIIFEYGIIKGAASWSNSANEEVLIKKTTIDKKEEVINTYNYIIGSQVQIREDFQNGILATQEIKSFDMYGNLYHEKKIGPFEIIFSQTYYKTVGENRLKERTEDRFWVTKYQYNEYGDVIQKEKYGFTYPELITLESYEYKYDSNNNIIDEKKYTKKPWKKKRELDFHRKTLYDSYNNEIQSTYFDDLNRIKRSITTNIEYDEFANWTRKVRYFDDEPYDLEERNIEYFRIK